ncbi:MAG: ubiquinone/menaquinone biosynthesis methyltransferase [Verrucomicrobia bacterium]|nr:ubiquinone/menaquinone biosynthesis methyltransferase [Verrucomicrobiota bacterium]
MANKFYDPGERRAAKVGDLFGAIASRYDLINDLQSFWLHRLWKLRLVKLAAVGPGQRALDLCCGTGDVAFRLARTGAEVVGLDFSEAMLTVARARFKVQGSKFKAGRGPQFMQGDAMQTAFPGAHFDAVTVAYGLRNLSSWEAGLREMWRVAKPGGRLLVLDFGRPDNVAWRRLYFAYLRWCVPLFGRLFCGDAELYAYILESLHHYPAQHGVAAKMRELGCAEVRIIPLLGGVMTINAGVKP